MIILVCNNNKHIIIFVIIITIIIIIVIIILELEISNIYIYKSIPVSWRSTHIMPTHAPFGQ